MGLFDSFQAKPDKDLTPAESILSVTVAAIAADGVIDDEEVVRIKLLAFLSNMFGNDLDEITATILKVAKYNNRIGVTEAMKRAKANLTPSLRETAFSWASDMILADGRVEKEEEQFLENLVSQLEVDPVVAKNVVDVTLVRNRAV